MSDSLTLHPRLVLNSLCCSNFPGIKRLILLQLLACWNYRHAPLYPNKNSSQRRQFSEKLVLLLNSLFGKIYYITSIPWNILYGNIIVNNWIYLKLVLRVIFQSLLGMGLYTCFSSDWVYWIYIFLRHFHHISIKFFHNFEISNYMYLSHLIKNIYVFSSSWLIFLRIYKFCRFSKIFL